VPLIFSLRFFRRSNDRNQAEKMVLKDGKNLPTERHRDDADILEMQ